MGERVEVLIERAAISERVAALGREISSRHAGRSLLVVGILKGAVVFCADLLRHLDSDATLDFMAVASYGSDTRSSGVVRILKDLDEGIEGRDVLVVEDIVDTGLTLDYLIRTLRQRGPRSLEVATFLDKAERRVVDVPVDYVGFKIDDAFVVGYGLDYDQRYRNLPDLCVLKLDPPE